MKVFLYPGEASAVPEVSTVPCQLLLRQRPRERIRWIVRTRGENSTVILHRLSSVTRLLIRFSEESQNQWIALIGFLKIGDRRPVIANVKSDVTGQIGKEAGLIGIMSLVESGLRGGYVFLCFVSLAAASRDASLGILPPKKPKILLVAGEIRFFVGRFVSRLVPLVSARRIAHF